MWTENYSDEIVNKLKIIQRINNLKYKKKIKQIYITLLLINNLLNLININNINYELFIDYILDYTFFKLFKFNYFDYFSLIICHYEEAFVYDIICKLYEIQYHKKFV